MAVILPFRCSNHSGQQLCPLVAFSMAAASEAKICDGIFPCSAACSGSGFGNELSVEEPAQLLAKTEEVTLLVLVEASEVHYLQEAGVLCTCVAALPSLLAFD